MKFILLLPLIFLCSCRTPQIAGTSLVELNKYSLVLDDSVVDYMNKMNIDSSETCKNSIFIFSSQIATVTTSKACLIKSNKISVFGGILSESTSTDYYNKKGLTTFERYATASFFCGLVNKSIDQSKDHKSYRSDLFYGVLYSGSQYENEISKINQSNHRFLLNSFGYYSIGHDSFITLLWIPIKI